jgi:hypothetical protein
MSIEMDEDMERTLRKERILGRDRGFHHSDAVKAAEELRMEGKGSHDPMYPHSKKNK